MISKAFLEELGVSQASFTTFVKANGIQKSEEVRWAIQNLLSGHNKPLKPLKEPVKPSIPEPRHPKISRVWNAYYAAYESYEEALWQREREEEQESYDEGDSASAESCCGVWEIGNCEGKKDFRREFLLGLQKGFRCFVYYSISKSITKAALGYGFQNTGSFTNHNTTNNIDVLVLNLWN